MWRPTGRRPGSDGGRGLRRRGRVAAGALPDEVEDDAEDQDGHQRDDRRRLLAQRGTNITRTRPRRGCRGPEIEAGPGLLADPQVADADEREDDQRDDAADRGDGIEVEADPPGRSRRWRSPRGRPGRARRIGGPAAAGTGRWTPGAAQARRRDRGPRWWHRRWRTGAVTVISQYPAAQHRLRGDREAPFRRRRSPPRRSGSRRRRARPPRRSRSRCPGRDTGARQLRAGSVSCFAVKVMTPKPRNAKKVSATLARMSQRRIPDGASNC